MRLFKIICVLFVLFFGLTGCFTTTDHEEEISEEKTVVEDEEKEITIEFEVTYTEDSKEYATIECIGEEGEYIWSYVTDEYDATELENVSEIGLFDDKYYFVENGTIICFDAYDGREIWMNFDFEGASPSFDFDEEDNLYICGYYGPDLFVVDSQGNTVNRIDCFNDNYYWPYNLKYNDGKVKMTLTDASNGNEVIYVVDVNDYSLEIK